jgi:arsenate reductase (thioredoxin)
VLVVADRKDLHHDTLFHFGMALPNKAAVIDAYHRAVAFGAQVEKPPRTTWKGTPLHELWLTDPDGTLIEVYARLTDSELTAMAADQAAASFRSQRLASGNHPGDMDELSQHRLGMTFAATIVI